MDISQKALSVCSKQTYSNAYFENAAIIIIMMLFLLSLDVSSLERRLFCGRCPMQVSSFWMSRRGAHTVPSNILRHRF